jgi:hypothetical protein
LGAIPQAQRLAALDLAPCGILGASVHPTAAMILGVAAGLRRNDRRTPFPNSRHWRDRPQTAASLNPWWLRLRDPNAVCCSDCVPTQTPPSVGRSSPHLRLEFAARPANSNCPYVRMLGSRRRNRRGRTNAGRHSRYRERSRREYLPFRALQAIDCRRCRGTIARKEAQGSADRSQEYRCPPASDLWSRNQSAHARRRLADGDRANGSAAQRVRAPLP